jgi:hypothetical protein
MTQSILFLEAENPRPGEPIARLSDVVLQNGHNTSAPEKSEVELNQVRAELLSVLEQATVAVPSVIEARVAQLERAFSEKLLLLFQSEQLQPEAVLMSYLNITQNLSTSIIPLPEPQKTSAETANTNGNGHVANQKQVATATTPTIRKAREIAPTRVKNGNGHQPKADQKTVHKPVQNDISPDYAAHRARVEKPNEVITLPFNQPQLKVVSAIAQPSWERSTTTGILTEPAVVKDFLKVTLENPFTAELIAQHNQQDASPLETSKALNSQTEIRVSLIAGDRTSGRTLESVTGLATPGQTLELNVPLNFTTALHQYQVLVTAHHPHRPRLKAEVVTTYGVPATVKSYT